MAAAFMYPPCSLRSTWGSIHRSCNCDAVVPGGEIREQAKEEDASTLAEMSTLIDDLFKLNELVNESNKGIGADVRTRVDVLYNRATLLKYSADRMVAGGGRVPLQLTATLKGLQREHASVENIVRLAMEAGPVLTDTEDPPSKVNPFSKEVEVEPTINAVPSDDQNQTLDIVVKEKEEEKAALFESLTRQSSLKAALKPTTSATGNYAMSTPAAEDSSPLAAFRKEIERRVMEQLAGNKVSTTDPSVPEKEEDKASTEGDATPQNNSVFGLLQNLPLRGRLPRRRAKGATKNELKSVETDSGEVEEAQLQTSEATETSSSVADVEQEPSAVDTETNSRELDKLKGDLVVLEQQLADAKEGSTRAEKAEAQLQQLSQEMEATVPLDFHEKAVRVERQSLLAARTKIEQVTAELKEKESILSAIKQDMTAEQDKLLTKVKELSGELSKRVSVKEIEAAVNSAVRELEEELRNALKRAESLKLELETNEKLLKKLQKEWVVERTSLRGEIANVKEKLTTLQTEKAADRAKLDEALDKVKGLEGLVAKLQQSMIEAEEERIRREKTVLATVRSLVADMVKAKRAQANSGTLESRLVEATKSLDGNDKSEDSEPRQASSAEDVLGSMFSGEKAIALETFFVMMGVLIQQESEKLETTDNQSRVDNAEGSLAAQNGGFQRDLSDMRSLKANVAKATKPIISLYYESSWEYAYLHYSVDGSAWTELPGVCMRNGIVVNSMPLKVIDVEGDSIEFVLTDGRGSWDCHPSGGNYHIRSSGTFLLSSGIIEQKR
ncbi:uncharacterized protein [Physcomitrium patens]|uniref:uncharacterized protein isoform X1 n=1 Tax=Physcomitrium patens TaxID=3218 RepID=UPI000D171366|nr:rootletin-like isoform X3 [Physcomitrium patens]|eukprot:XP_024372112.1 rootletin-like isoform X3 [Physcomitrella patens]